MFREVHPDRGVIHVDSDAVNQGWNAENATYSDDRYVKCSKCGFTCHLDKDRRSTYGSRLGIGTVQPSTQLNGALTAGGTTVTVDSTTGFPTPSSGSITAFAATSQGTRVTSAAHGLGFGTQVRITGAADYSGFFYISNIATNTFDIETSFVTDTDFLIEQIIPTTSSYVQGDFSGTEYRVAQSFVLDASTVITDVSVDFDTSSSPSGNVTYRIETDSSGPSGTLADTSATKEFTPVGDSWNKQTFATSFTLAAGTYWLVLTCDNQSANKFWLVAMTPGANSVYSDGAFSKSEDGGSTWTEDTDWDIAFKVYGTNNSIGNWYKPEYLSIHDAGSYATPGDVSSVYTAATGAPGVNIVTYTGVSGTTFTGCSGVTAHDDDMYCKGEIKASSGCPHCGSYLYWG